MGKSHLSIIDCVTHRTQHNHLFHSTLFDIWIINMCPYSCHRIHNTSQSPICDYFHSIQLNIFKMFFSHSGAAELALLPPWRPGELRHEAEHHPLPRQRDQPRGDTLTQILMLQARITPIWQLLTFTGVLPHSGLQGVLKPPDRGGLRRQVVKSCGDESKRE